MSMIQEMTSLYHNVGRILSIVMNRNSDSYKLFFNFSIRQLVAKRRRVV
jgi:hypothetical protein